MEKGIGNVFTENKTTFSARDALYIDYRFVPAKKLRQFEFGFESGIYHMNLDNLEFEQNYSVYRNHGEVDYYWSKMTYEDLIFLSSSINIFYSINAKHKIKIAAGFDKLITSKIDMTYKSNFENPAESNNGEWGINKGINTLDFTFGMGYEFEINSKFSFVFDTKFGTLDKTNNDYLRNTKNSRMIKAQNISGNTTNNEQQEVKNTPPQVTAPKAWTPYGNLTITYIETNGNSISLSDNTTWIIAPNGRFTVRNWHRGDVIKIEKDSQINSSYPFIMQLSTGMGSIRVKPVEETK